MYFQANIATDWIIDDLFSSPVYVLSANERKDLTFDEKGNLWIQIDNDNKAWSMPSNLSNQFIFNDDGTQMYPDKTETEITNELKKLPPTNSSPSIYNEVTNDLSIAKNKIVNGVKSFTDSISKGFTEIEIVGAVVLVVVLVAVIMVAKNTKVNAVV